VTTADEGPVDAAREGLEHLQSAAHEMVAAARSMLDAVEELIDDPRAAAAMATAFGTLSRLVEGAVSSVSSALTSHGPADDDEPRVQRIKVS
jgi:hypothetical protein